VKFTPDQKKLVIHALGEAEEQTSRYYCIPPFRWQQLQYDLLTGDDREWIPLPEPILAQLQLFHRFSPVSKSTSEFYRIQLNDPSILMAAERELLVSDLYPFLVFILTHEMVHLVRLSSLLNVTHPDKAAESEEMRVQHISRQIFSKTNYHGMKGVIDRFCSSGREKECSCNLIIQDKLIDFSEGRLQPVP